MSSGQQQETINSYSKEKMLEFYESPFCLLRPDSFHHLVRDVPEIMKEPPQPLITAADAEARLELVSNRYNVTHQ